jgi:hypothetical protein
MPLELWLAMRLLLARPRQTTLSVLGVVVGVAALIIMRSMTLGFLNQFVAKMVEVVAHVEVVSEEVSAYFQPTDTDATKPIRQALQESFLPTFFVPTRPAEPRPRKGIADWEGLARTNSPPASRLSPSPPSSSWKGWSFSTNARKPSG